MLVDQSFIERPIIETKTIKETGIIYISCLWKSSFVFNYIYEKKKQASFRFSKKYFINRPMEVEWGEEGEMVVSHLSHLTR